MLHREIIYNVMKITFLHLILMIGIAGKVYTDLLGKDGCQDFPLIFLRFPLIF